MEYTGLCVGSLNDYTLPDWRLKIESKFFGTDVDKIIKVTRIDGVVERDEAALVYSRVCKEVQVLILSYIYQRCLGCGMFEITFTASGRAR